MKVPTPEWFDATVRYSITIAGVILVQQDLMPQTSWDQIAAALTSISTALYGVFRTKQVEQEAQATAEALQTHKRINGALAAQVTSPIKYGEPV